MSSLIYTKLPVLKNYKSKIPLKFFIGNQSGYIEPSSFRYTES